MKLAEKLLRTQHRRVVRHVPLLRRNRDALAVTRTPVREGCDRAVDVAGRVRLQQAPNWTLPRLVGAAVEEEARDEKPSAPLPRLAVNPDDVLVFLIKIYEGGQVKSLAGFAPNVTVNKINSPWDRRRETRSSLCKTRG